MLREQDVIAGKFYMNKERKVAREVLGISRRTVTFNTYHVDTGNSCGSPSECLVEDFVRWASREVSSTELGFLQYQSIAVEYQTSDR